MLDQPKGVDIVEAVARLLRDTLMPRLPADIVFQARVAANALDLVAREMKLGVGLDHDALQRLRALLGHDGSLLELETELAAAIRDGRLAPQHPGLMDHLWASTLAKMAVDQPAYASYRRELQARAGANQGGAGGAVDPATP